GQSLMKKLLRLYVVGQTPAAAAAIETLQSQLSDPALRDWELEVVDVIEKPHLAEEDRIVAVPAVIKKLPPPLKRFVGDLSNKEQTLLGLDLLINGQAN
ncbi:MAG: circadian clock KaiB family protein, partial [Sedimenticola sp.]